MFCGSFHGLPRWRKLTFSRLLAQMMPERNYLRAVLPSILSEDKVGLVKTGHGFINLPQRLDQTTATLMAAADTDAYVPFPPLFSPLRELTPSRRLQ
jgi:hypothetical protein